MLYLDRWEKVLSREFVVLTLILCLLFFVLCESVLFSRLRAEAYFEKGMKYLARARSIPGDLIVQKSLQYQNALRSLRKSFELNALDARGYFESAQAIEDIADDYGLKTSFDGAAFGVRQNNKEGFYRLAQFYYIRALEREPTNAVYHHRLGKAYSLLGNSDAAEREYKKAVKLDPQNFGLHFYLSQYYFSRGNDREFMYHITKAIELSKILAGGKVLTEVEDFLKSAGKDKLLLR